MNKLAITILSEGTKQVMPVMLTAPELTEVAPALYVQEGITLSTNLQDVRPQLYMEDGQFYTAFHIPIMDKYREFNIFQVTPIPFFHEGKIHAHGTPGIHLMQG